MGGFPLKLFMALNTFAIRASRGRLGSRLGTQTILLLHSLGRRSGRPRVTPIACFYLDGFYFLVGSNWGKPVNAAWYHNLLAHPQTLIEVKGRRIPVLAHPAEGPEYARLWKYATQHHPPYLRYQHMTSRHIPIMILQPADPEASG
jgi:F420H(2)-dependent quinone reductase